MAGACAVLALVTAAAIIGRRRYPYVFVGWFWFLGMLVPVLGFVQVADHAMSLIVHARGKNCSSSVRCSFKMPRAA